MIAARHERDRYDHLRIYARTRNCLQTSPLTLPYAYSSPGRRRTLHAHEDFVTLHRKQRIEKNRCRPDRGPHACHASVCSKALAHQPPVQCGDRSFVIFRMRVMSWQTDTKLHARTARPSKLRHSAHGYVQTVCFSAGERQHGPSRVTPTASRTTATWP